MSFIEDEQGAPAAELDIFAETGGAKPCGLELAGLRVPGARTEQDLAGQVIIEPAGEALLGIGSLRAASGLEGLGEAIAAAGAAAGAAATDLPPGPEPAEPAEPAPAPPLLADDADVDALDDDGAPPALERSAFVPGMNLAVERVRVELGEPRDGRLEALVHFEADAYADEAEDGDDDDDGPLADEIDVAAVAVLRARLERCE